LFVAVNSVPLSGEQAIAAASLRQVIEAKGVLVWQHPHKLTEHHIAAAIEAAWQLALMSLSTQEAVHSQQYYDLILAELARKPAKLTQGKMLDALKSYYANVRVCVDSPSLGRSAPFDSTMGVKQGCPMSLTLFGLYID